MSTSLDTMPGFSEPERRLWVYAMLVEMRLRYELDHQLAQAGSLSLSDYGILVGLNQAENQTMCLKPLAARIGWELSRLSRHVRRMESRGLVTLSVSATDGRATEVSPTEAGWEAFREAIAGHADLARELYVEAMPAELVPACAEALEHVYARLTERGSLPSPADLVPVGIRPER